MVVYLSLLPLTGAAVVHNAEVAVVLIIARALVAVHLLGVAALVFEILLYRYLGEGGVPIGTVVATGFPRMGDGAEVGVVGVALLVVPFVISVDSLEDLGDYLYLLGAGLAIVDHPTDHARQYRRLANARGRWLVPALPDFWTREVIGVVFVEDYVRHHAVRPLPTHQAANLLPSELAVEGRQA